VPAIVPAVPVPVIVNPTCSGVNRRPPEGTPPVPTDYAPDNQTDRTGNHQALAGTENRADVIRVPTTSKSALQPVKSCAWFIPREAKCKVEHKRSRHSTRQTGP
jgi:hypothetical protein